MTNTSLFVATSLDIAKRGRNFFLTRKFVDGMSFYASAWPGRVVAAIEKRKVPTKELDNIEVSPSDLPFSIDLHDTTSQLLSSCSEAGIVLTGLLGRGIPHACAKYNVPVVCCTEYSLRTRLQILRSTKVNPILLARRAVWELNQERRIRDELKASNGLQANGVPTYDKYKGIVQNSLLYFDSRVEKEEQASTEQVKTANVRRLQGKKLKLAFSGRLIPMKGVKDLIAVADRLRQKNIDFELSIFGDGELRSELLQGIDARSLQNHVFLRGVYDFHSQLLPHMISDVDLFVCPHVQGDPSCTYLETLSCGVPIVGYDNEAFLGITRLASVGWSVPLGHADLLADEIARLDSRRAELADKAMNARDFAIEHGFETTSQCRIDHLFATMERAQRQPHGRVFSFTRLLAARGRSTAA